MKSLLFGALIPVILVSFPSKSALSNSETGVIQGTILDGRTGKPLRGVTLRLIGSERETRTDIKGGFHLAAPAGTYAGLVVQLPRGGGLALIEAEVPIQAGATEDLGSLEVFPTAVSSAESGERQDLSSSGEAMTPWLGIVPLEVAADYGPRGGSGVAVSVDRVFRESPADLAGFQRGDFIDYWGGHPVTGAYALFELIAKSPTDSSIEVRIGRRGHPMTLTPRLVRIPAAALQAIRDLTSPEAAPPTMGDARVGPPAGPSFQSGSAPAVHPILQEARRQAKRGNFHASDRAYEEYLAAHPEDGRTWAEYAEMVFHNIQNARGMQLMAQAVRKPGLTPREKTRLRLLIARKRLESGNLVTAQQMLLEAKREDPYNPVIDDLLQTIEIIILQSSGRSPGLPHPIPLNQPGGNEADANRILINDLLGKISKELAKKE